MTLAMALPDAPRTLVVTNDFPPRVGGVQQYVWRLVAQLPPDRVAVLAPAWAGWREHDAAQPFAVHRWPESFLWPTPDLERRVACLSGEFGADVVLFGHGFPLPWLAPAISKRVPCAALTHGAEVWIARAPGLAAAQRRGLQACAEVTAVSAYTGDLVRAAIGERPVTVLYPGVDTERYAPEVDGGWVRERYGLRERRVVVCVSRLVPRKGQDVLIEAMPTILRSVPDAALLLVGDGPERASLQRAAAAAPPGTVVLAGEVPDEDLPAHYAAGDVFAMPCRSRFGGLEVEGLGIVFLEAAACGKATVAGRSGGAPEAIVDQRTGLLVEGNEPKAVGLAVARLLANPEIAAAMGAAGRARVEAGFTWARSAATLGEVLARAAAAGVG
jgi:phosphatidyl-myo-inositol dimannoside synthase